MKKVDYLLEALKYHGGRNDGFLTDQPVGIKLAEDGYVKVRYDAKAMRWIPQDEVGGCFLHSRPSIKYPTAKELIKQYRRELAEKLG